LNQSSQLPFTDTEIVGGLPRSEKTAVVMHRGRRKSHRENLYCHLARTDVLCQCVYKHY
jgi:hypothetical protein